MPEIANVYSSYLCIIRFILFQLLKFDLIFMELSNKEKLQKIKFRTFQ